MNYKLEKFWNSSLFGTLASLNFMNYKLEKFWNLNNSENIFFLISMNYKLEKFWNKKGLVTKEEMKAMNYKLEKFWNWDISSDIVNSIVWTINLKSFEIILIIFLKKIIINEL